MKLRLPFSSVQSRQPQSISQRRTQTWVGRVRPSTPPSRCPPSREYQRSRQKRGKGASKPRNRSGTRPPVWFVEFTGSHTNGSPGQESGSLQGTDQENQVPGEVPGNTSRLITSGSVAPVTRTEVQGVQHCHGVSAHQPISAQVHGTTKIDLHRHHGQPLPEGFGRGKSTQKSDKVYVPACTTSTAIENLLACNEQANNVLGEWNIGTVRAWEDCPCPPLRQPLADTSSNAPSQLLSALPAAMVPVYGTHLSSLSTHPLAVPQPAAVTQSVARRMAAVQSAQAPQVAEDPEAQRAAAKYAATTTVTVRPHERLYRSLPQLPDPSAASQSAAAAASRLAERRRTQITQRHLGAREVDVLAPSISDLWKRQDYSDKVRYYPWMSY
jgi:hypothetical protein